MFSLYPQDPNTIRLTSQRCRVLNVDDIIQALGFICHVNIFNNEVLCESLNVLCEYLNIVCESLNVLCKSLNVMCETLNVLCESLNVLCESLNVL